MGEISEALARAREDEGMLGREAPRERVPMPTPTPGPSSRRPEPVSEEPVSESRTSERPRVEVDRAAPLPVDQDPGQAPPPSPRRIEVPRDQSPGWIARICAVDPDCCAAVRFSHLAVRLRGMLERRSPRSVLVTSALPREGKTTVSVNLALALASVSPDHRVALVDLDLRCARVANVFEYECDQGVESAFAGEMRVEEARVETDIPNLDVFPTSKPTRDAHALIASSAERVLHELHARYDYVICDGPPVLPVPDVPLLVPYVGGCLAVIAAGKTRHVAFRELVDLVPASTMFGAFLNQSAGAGKDGRYAYYGNAEHTVKGGDARAKDDRRSYSEAQRLRAR